MEKKELEVEKQRARIPPVSTNTSADATAIEDVGYGSDSALPAYLKVIAE